MDRNFIQKLLIGIFAIACLIFGLNLFTSSEYAQGQTQNDKLEVNGNVSSSRMTYGRFLEYLEKEKLDLAKRTSTSSGAIPNEFAHITICR